MGRVVKLVRINKKLKYNLVVMRKGEKNYIEEVLGIFNLKTKSLKINLFRLSFWVSTNISMTGNVRKLLLEKYIISDN